MSTPPSLPVELWLQIFRLSTISSLTARLHAISYQPFETVPLLAEDEDETRTKCALVQVCKQWRAWAMELLFEDVWVGRPDKLRPVLERSTAGMDSWGYGQWVRRANLPYTSSTTVSPRPLEALQVLEQCPRLEVLVRRGPARGDFNMRFEFPTPCPPLPSLKRVDWWHLNDAARSGGINLLGDVLSNAPNVQYLSLGGHVMFTPLSVNSSAITLPSLTTLRFLRLNALLVRQTCYWSMPALRHLIIDSVDDVSVLELFWEVFGHQICTIELGHYLTYFIYDWLSSILSGCPFVEELNYYLHFTAVPSIADGTTFNSLTTVRLHAHPNMMVSSESTEYWKRIQGHLALFSRPHFPVVKRVLLHGDWNAIENNIRFLPLTQPLLDRGIAVQRVTA